MIRFRKYCVVIIGNTKDVESEIVKICEGKPNILDGKGLYIATFVSNCEISELTEWFKQNDRNFLVFDLDKDVAGCFIDRPDINACLFGFLESVNLSEMNDNFNKVVEMPTDLVDVDSTTKTIGEKLKGGNRLKETEIKKMNAEQRLACLNDLIDNVGLETLSVADKELLPLLAK